ncbi:MAG: hypothetical protein U9P38_06185 [Campylobacterota bacterium]|nr:hypothetical protein [Campylobacterota bacterium]
MGGVHFEFEDFKQLISLNIGIAERIDDNRKESFSVLYCDFSDMPDIEVVKSLEQILRNADSVINYKTDYFFIFPYTDKYGANCVKEMFDDFFGKSLNSSVVSYPIDGEKSENIIFSLQNITDEKYNKSLDYLDRFIEDIEE